MNVILIGFRCSGKSSVGQELARRLKHEFVDSDEYIESRTHLSIREIFDIAGESYFRLLEADALADLTKLDGKVIATGGGAVLRYKNIRAMKRNGLLFFMDVDAPHAYERIRQDPKTKTRRPRLTDRDPYNEIQEQIEFRKPYYLGAADLVVQTAGREVEEVVQEIVQHLKERGFPVPEDDADAQIA